MERVAFPLAGGGEVVVEVDDVPQGRQLASRGGGVGRQKKCLERRITEALGVRNKNKLWLPLNKGVRAEIVS